MFKFFLSRYVKNETVCPVALCRQRRLRLEPLEERQMLSVNPVPEAVWSEVTAKYSDLNWSDVGDYNYIEITTENLTEANLRDAIFEAGTTEENDLIVVRTSATQNLITLDGTEVAVNINADSYGSTTIVSLGEKPLTLDADGQTRVLGNMGVNSVVTLAGLTMTNGQADFAGGIYNAGTLTVTHCELSENSAISSGGAIYSTGVLTVINSTVSGNSAQHGGGIYFFGDDGELTMTNSVIAGNCAITSGGGIYTAGTTTMTNCTIAGNFAATSDAVIISGGGIYNFEGTTTIRNSVIANNATPQGMDNVLTYNSSQTFTNVAYSLIDNIARPNGGKAFTDLGYNITNVAPRFVAIPETIDANNTGLNYDSTSWDLRLQPGSPAINKGNDAYIITPFDIDGNSRIINTVDMGAYEYVEGVIEPEPPSVIVTTLNDDISVYDYFISLREAIVYANDGDTITFAEEIWGQTITLGGSELYIDKSIIIDATGANITIDANDESRVFNISVGITVELIGLTITGGKTPDDSGGGIKNAGTLTLTNCKITENTASKVSRDYYAYGGGIYNDGTLTVVNCEISGNSVSSNESSVNGGGIYNSGTLTVTDSTIIENTAYSVFGGNGGGIYSSGLLTVTNSTISENTISFSSSTYGGGIFSDGDLTLTNSIISGNTVSGTYASGGGIYSIGTSKWENCIISGNTADSYSGPNIGGIHNDGTSTLTNCRISGNIGHGISNAADNSTLILTDCMILDNSNRGILSTRPNSTLTLSNCVISGNQSRGIEATSSTLSLTDCVVSGNKGTGIYASGDAAPLMLTGCTISENTVDSVGYGPGGIYCYLGMLTLTDCTITGNSTYWDAGAIYSTNATLTNCTISDNSSRTGGGIYNYGALTVTNSTVSGNTADDNGGGIYNYYSAAATILLNCTITGNTAGNDGGGIYNINSSGSPVLTNCTITGNSANSGGGIYNRTIMTLTGCVITGNTADTSGGGIYSDSTGLTTLVNCVIAGNAADTSGGGIHCAPSGDTERLILTLTNSTVSGNTAVTGGGIYVNPVYTQSGIVTINNSIVVENSVSDIAYRPGTISNIRIDHSLLASADWSNGSGNIIYIPSKPLFADAANGDYRLAPNSQAINRGDNVFATMPFDLAGHRRIAGGIVDIGAYEYDASTFVGNFVVSATWDQLTGVPYINELNLREALLLAKDGSIITFDPALFADDREQTLTLTEGELKITNSVAIIGVTDDEGNSLLTIEQTGGKSRAKDGESRVMSVVGKADEIVVVLENLTLTDGKVSTYGGALYANNAQLTLTNVTMTDNEARWGGAIYQIGGELTIISGDLSNNLATWGGAIYQAGGELRLEEVTISGNNSTWGGGLYQAGGVATLTDNTNITNNEARNTYGKALAKAKGATLLIENADPNLFDTALSYYLDEI